MRSHDPEMIIPAELRTRPSLAGVQIGRDYRVARLPAVAIQRAGGRSTHLIDRPILNINVWASSDTAVNALATTLVTELEACQDHQPILWIDTSGPATVPSDVTGASQRFITADAAIRREPT